MFVKVPDLESLQGVLALGQPITLIGNGSNMLISDQGTLVRTRVSEVSSAPRNVCRMAMTGSGDGSGEDGLGGTTSWGHRDAWELNFLSGLTTVRPRSSPKPDAEPTADCGLRSPVRPRTRARPRCCKASLQGQKRGPKVKLGTAKLPRGSLKVVIGKKIHLTSFTTTTSTPCASVFGPHPKQRYWTMFKAVRCTAAARRNDR